jgi:hypothetical protein
MAKKAAAAPNIIKSCYSHLGGRFGLRLATRFEELGWIEKDPQSKHFVITPKGEKEFRKLGVDTEGL